MGAKEKSKNTVLVVVAHPDDEVLGCGASILKHVAEGDEVHLLFLADGVLSRSESKGCANAVVQRNRAAENCAGFLGVRSCQSSGFADNEMDSLSLLTIVKEIERVVSEVEPDIVYTHHSADLNIDHRITHQAVMTACRPQPGFCVRRILAFEVLSSTEWQSVPGTSFQPNHFVDVSLYFEQKLKALEFYSEEMRDFPHSRSYGGVKALASYRGCSVGMEYAEAFVLLRDLVR